MAPLFGQYFTTKPDENPCPFEVIFDRDSDGAEAKRLLEQAGIRTINKGLVGQFTMNIYQPGGWAIVEEIEELSLRPHDELGSQ